jgi:hypothetical protein
MRIKALFSDRHHARLIQRLPGNLTERMPLRINDMLMLTSLGEIDGREGFHNEFYIYPLGYKCCCVCPSAKTREGLTWFEGSIEERNDKPLFVVKQLKGDGTRYVGTTPGMPFEELRAKLMKKTRKWLPPIDGHEMFGFTSAFVHRLLIEMKGFERCLGYRRRFFRSNIGFVNEWPTIGQFEANPEKLAQVIPTTLGTTKTKLKKKAFKDSLPPLILNFAPLFAGEERNLVLSVRSEGTPLRRLFERYEKWEEPNLDDFVPPSGPV